MKKLLLICVLLPSFALAQVWQEKFDGLANGATADAGLTSWTTTTPSGGAASFSKQMPVTGYEVFLIDNTSTEGEWTSGLIDIASLQKVALEVVLYSNFTFSSDYIRCYYKVDGNAEIQFGELQGANGLNITSAVSAIVSGSTLQIIIRGKDNTSGSTNGILNGLAFDDVTVTSITDLYSISSGNWNNTNTWSTGGYNGTSCSCTPTANTQVFIGNNRNVSVPGAATSAGMTIQQSGRLQFTGDTSFTMARGGTLTIDNGGAINNNGGNGNIIYGAYAYSIITNGTLNISTLTANAGSSISVSGSGSVSVTNFLINSGNGRSIVLNAAGGFNISNDLNFQSGASNVSFINRSPLTIANRILFTANAVSFTNNAAITAGSIVVNSASNNNNNFTNASTATLNVGDINLNNGDFILDNSGIINQTGNFSNIDNGTTFRNLNGSVWNFSGGGSNTRLFCNNGTNTFNYTAAGAQNVFVPADAYSNLTLSTSGLKTLSGNLDVNKNLNIDNTAQLDISSSLYGVTIAGNWNITSTNANPFVERTGTVTLDGTSDQTISTVLGTETFNNLILNKASGNAIQSSSIPTDIVVSNNISLLNGGISINGRTLTLSNSSTAAITRTNGCIISETSAAPYSYLKWMVGTSTGSFVYPFGKTTAAADYIPFTFNITSAGVGAGSVAVTTYATGANNLPLPSGVHDLKSNIGTDNGNNTVDRFWYITLNSYTANPTTNVTFVATASEVGSIGTLRAQRWNAITNKWDPPKSGQTNTANSATVTGVTTFSPWAMTGNDIPMPIHLLYFNAFLENDEVRLEWKTAQEINNDFYTVQKAIDQEHFQDVATMKGAGTTNTTHLYHNKDTHIFTGKSYYRLKQTDFDGNETYFKPVMIEYEGPIGVLLNVYPIPSQAHELTVNIEGLQPYQNLSLDVIDISGKKMFTENITADQSGKFSEKIFMDHPLSRGMYFLKAGLSLSLIKKIIID